MKKNNLISIIILSMAIYTVLLFGFTVMAQEPKFSMPDLKTHHIKSKFVDQEFIITVSMPIVHDNETEKFPVLYCLDSNFFYPRDITHLLQGVGEVPRFILVGIGYPGKHFLSSFNLRARDMTPVEDVIDMPPAEGFVRGVHVPKGIKYGGAKEFLEFIRQELIPFIDNNYPTIKGNRAINGHSLGGLFGLYVLFNKPDTFDKYIIGSPSIQWGEEFILKQAETFVADNNALKANIFMAAGSLEETGENQESRTVTNMFRMENILRKKKLKGLDLRTRLFPDETHLTVGPMNYVHGIKSIYKKPATHFQLKYLEKK
ncbi:MAG: alpha/beta hydrolase-fold protein [Desulfobacteraceae bacterium]